MKTPANNAAINFVGFQLGWFACVLGAANQLPWLGIVVAIPILGWHLWQANNPRLEIALMLIATVFGSLFDQSLLSLGLIEFAPNSWPSALLPAWMMVLWMLFVTTLNVSLRWMRDKYVISILFGLIGGPLAYWGGTKLGAMHLLKPTAILITLSLGWGVFMPVLLWLSARLDGYTHMASARKEVFTHV